MTSNYSTHKLDDLIKLGILEVNDGYRAKNSELSHVGIPFARAGNIDEGFHFEKADKVPPETLRRVGKKRSKMGDVVFTSKGTVGRLALVREHTPEFVYSPQLCYWRSLDQGVIDSSWLFYWMQSDAFLVQYKRVSGQTDMAEYVSLRDQRGMNICVPPIERQNYISKILGDLDDKIEQNRRMNETLEAMARALFKSWFVDFDPVRAKLDGRQPSGLNPSTAALFPDRLHHTDYGVIPEGWTTKRWGEIASLEYGKSLKDYASSHGRFPVYGTNGPIGYHDRPLCLTEGIIIGRKGAYRGVHFSNVPFFVIDTAFYVKPKLPLSIHWAYYELLRFDLNGMDSGSAIPSTSRDDFYGIPLIFPPFHIQKAFGEIMERWFEMKVSNDQSSKVLSRIRDTLLPELLGGSGQRPIGKETKV